MTDVAGKLSRVAAELGAQRREPAYPIGGDRWAQDYGKARRLPRVDSARLHDGRIGLGDGDRGPVRKGRLDDSRSLSLASLWREMKAALCPGTRIFLGCLALATFIVFV